MAVRKQEAVHDFNLRFSLTDITAFVNTPEGGIKIIKDSKGQLYIYFFHTIDNIFYISGKGKTPLYISFACDYVIVGDVAKDDLKLCKESVVYGLFYSQLFVKSKKFISDIFKFLALSVDEVEVNPDWGFELQDGENGINVNFYDRDNEKCQISAIDVMALFIKVMKNIAEEYLKRETKNVKILISADIGASQRVAIKKAVEMCGLHCV